MTEYWEYRAYDANGCIHHGFVRSQGPQAAMVALRQRGLQVFLLQTAHAQYVQRAGITKALRYIRNLIRRSRPATPKRLRRKSWLVVLLVVISAGAVIWLCS